MKVRIAARRLRRALGRVRPAGVGRVHFSCDGPASEKLACIHGEFIRVGDTASGKVDGAAVLLRCDAILAPHGARWGVDEEWSSDAARLRIKDADLVVVIQ